MRLIKHRQGGFTLIEAVIAFMILITVMTVLFESLQLSARYDRRADKIAAASRVAVNRIALLGVTEKLVTGTVSGRSSDGMEWVQTIRPYSANFMSVRSQLYVVHIAISERDFRGRSNTLFDAVTLKGTPKPSNAQGIGRQ